MSLWFITPAFSRFELVAICLAQRKRVIDQLATHGIEAHCVVVADDENLDIAASFGFATVEQNNDWLGRRFNDGMEYAGRQGADWICLIGSDDWIDPAYFVPLPRAGRGLTSHLYAPVMPDRLAECFVRRQMAGPRVFHRSLLEGVGFRPQAERIKRNTDHSTLAAIGPVRWTIRDLHPLQYVGFREPPFITQYASLWERWGVAEDLDPWSSLAAHYDADLVERARAVMVGSS